MGIPETVGYGRYSLGPRTSITVTGSPFTYRNDDNTPQEIFISVGTVTAIDFSRDGSTWDSCGLVAGQFRLNPGDSIKVTYGISPTMIHYPF